MSTPDPQSTTDQSSQKVSFKFCGSCSNLLYPVEDRQTSTLHFVCQNNCPGGSVSDGTAIVYRNDLSNKVGETAGMTQDIGQDPTVRLPTVAPSASASASASAPAPAPAPAVAKHLPEFCTMCGQEILCEVCGQPNARGIWLEVNDKNDGTTSTTMHAMSDDDNTNTNGYNFGDLDIDFYDEAMLSDPASDDDFGEYFITSGQPTPRDHVDDPLQSAMNADDGQPSLQSSDRSYPNS